MSPHGRETISKFSRSCIDYAPFFPLRCALFNGLAGARRTSCSSCALETRAAWSRIITYAQRAEGTPLELRTYARAKLRSTLLAPCLCARSHFRRGTGGVPSSVHGVAWTLDAKREAKGLGTAKGHGLARGGSRRDACMRWGALSRRLTDVPDRAHRGLSRVRVYDLSSVIAALIRSLSWP